MIAMQQQFARALESLTRQNVDLQAELAQNRQQAASELAALRQEIRAPLRGSQTWESLASSRMLKKRLEGSVQGVRWRRGATSAEADGGSCESGSADPGGRRSDSVGTAPLDDAHDLQENRVSGG